MANGMYRIGIVGATSLVGKELGDELQDSLLATSDFILLDEEEASGQVASVADEAAVIQPIEAGSFNRMDFVFFAGEGAKAREHWQTARKTGASIIDLTYGLEGQPEVLVRAPWVSDTLKDKAPVGGQEPDLTTPAVVAANPAAVMFALIAARLAVNLPLTGFAATLMEPASEHSREAMDELHQQTVNLLSFQTLPQEQYDSQVSFNLLPSLGEAAKVKLFDVESQVRSHYETISAGRLPALDLQLVQAPVFHGLTASILVDMEEPVTLEQVEAALAGDHVDVVAVDSDPPSNLSAAGQENILIRARAASGASGGSRRFWLWVAADNLKLKALNGIACANELRRLRPLGKVQ